HQSIPFIFVSGFKDQNTLNAISKTKNDGFILKDQPLSFLKEWIRYLLTPPDRRPNIPPVEKSDAVYKRTRDESYHRRR
ncbi:MAG TPA: hypothetical protein VGR15_01455, partial [Bacteroidota bacterium]|nr:hypothetical protein [Bacteroidota bacterium]